MTHAVRHDYCCNDCNAIQEFYGYPDRPCTCGGSWHLVFTAAPAMHITHCSTVDEVIKNNERIQARVIEEDSEPTSESGKALIDFIANSADLGGH